MQRSSGLSSRFARPNYFAEVTLALVRVRDVRSSGRLSVRNCEGTGLAHLYFRDACLVHVAGDKRDAESVLNDLLSWSKGHVRFDSAIAVDYEDVTWQQGEIFARWLSLLEMHGVTHGIARSRLIGLTQRLTAQLPGKPIVLPAIVEHYEEHKEATRAQQWQQLNEGMQHFIERALPGEQREQLWRFSQSTAQYVGEAVQQAGRVTHELTKRAAQVTQEVARQATELAHETAKHAAVRTEGAPSEKRSKERHPQSIPPTHHSLQSSGKTIVPTTQHLLTPQRRLRSIRPDSALFPAVARKEECS